METEKNFLEKPLSKEAMIILLITLLVIHTVVTFFTVPYLSPTINMTLIKAIKIGVIILAIPIPFALWVGFVPSWRMKNIPNKFTWGYIMTTTVLSLGQIGIIFS